MKSGGQGLDFRIKDGHHEVRCLAVLQYAYASVAFEADPNYFYRYRVDCKPIKVRLGKLMCSARWSGCAATDAALGTAIRKSKAIARWLFLTSILQVLVTIEAGAQALPGTSGLISIPTATITTDGDMAVGVNLIAPRYHEYAGDGFDEESGMVDSRP